MTGPKGEKKIVQDAVYLGGMCAECEGRGTVSDLDLSVIVDESKSLTEGAILVPGYTADGWMVASSWAGGTSATLPVLSTGTCLKSSGRCAASGQGSSSPRCFVTLNAGPSSADSVPVPLLVLGGLALALIAAAAVSFFARRAQAKRASDPPPHGPLP